MDSDELLDSLRGGADEEGADVADAADAASNGSAAAFLHAHGLLHLDDEGEEGDADTAGEWSKERLDAPLHAHTEATTRQAIYTLMMTASTVHKTTLDRLIKAFKALLPEENNLPGCANHLPVCMLQAQAPAPIGRSPARRMHRC